MGKVIRLGTLFWLVVWSLTYLQATPDFPYRFRCLTTDDGLSQNTVDYIYRDSRGFMWFATWNGLCRYDGYQFKVFKSDGTATGLPSNFVHALAESSTGLLWIGTTEGLAVYDLDHDRFVSLEGLPEPLSRLRVNAICPTTDGRVWVGTDTDGLYLLDPLLETRHQQVLTVRLQKTDLSGKTVNAIHAATDNSVLIGTNSGLWRSDVEDEPTVVSLASAPSGRIISILTGEEYCWVGTDVGLIRLHQSNGAERHYQAEPRSNNSLLHNSVTSLAFDMAGGLLVGTLGGLNIYRPDTDDFFGIGEESTHRSSLNNRFVNSISADSIGNVWIGTEKGGINQYNIHQHRFGTILHQTKDPQSLSNGKVNSILVEQNGLWIGTAGGGLNWVCDLGTVTQVYQNVPGQNNSISNNFVTSLLRDANGQLWMGTWGGGLNQLNGTPPGTFTVTTGLASNFVSSLHEDVNGLLLVGTENGLDLLDSATGKVIHLDAETVGVDISEVGSILLDRHDDYWIGTRRGLYRFPARKIRGASITLAFDDIDFYDREDDLLSGNYVLSLREASDGSLWVGTYGHGVSRITRNGGKFSATHYSENDGLCNNVVYAIQEGRNGNLWLSTDYGLSSFNPKKESFKNYYTIDGLPSNQFYWSASAADARGNLYFGSIDGLLHFDPEKISDYPAQPMAALTRLTAMGESVRPGQYRHGHEALPTTIDQADQMQLSYLDNTFTLEFAALDYFLSDKIRFSYRMRGVDQDWVTVPSSRRFASYTNLEGGNYLFEVKASNGEGQWQEKPTRLMVIIHPPFWQTPWFKLLLALATIGTIVAYIRWRTRYLKRQTRKLESLVRQRTTRVAQQKDILEQQADRLRKSNETLEQRQREIAAQKTELETKNEEISQQRDQLIDMNAQVRKVNELRLRFFTNVSHEFRTPLTLIINPIEELMTRFRKEETAHGTLGIIHRNARRLLHLINQLMDFRAIEEGKSKLRLSHADLGAFLSGVGESFRGLARQRSVDYQLSLPTDTLRVWFDPEKLEHVVYNLLSNAFKYTPAGGKVRLTLTLHQPPGLETPDSFTVTVSDSGVGMNAEVLEHIFDPFYRVPGTVGRGSGIGLSLTREMVNLQHGNIEVVSKPLEGSTFMVNLPCSREAFEPEELTTGNRLVATSLASRVGTLQENLERVERDQAKPNSSIRSNSNKPSILVVEDNQDLRTFLKQSLESDFRVLEAADGKEGYDLARRYSPEVIISDIMMPRMNGIELCRKLKGQIQTSHIPIILLTAKALVENYLEGLHEGADDYIPKPCNMEILRAKIRNLIRSRRQLKKIFVRSATPKAAEVTTNPLDQEFLEKLYGILDETYSDASTSQEEIAERMCISRSLLYKKVRSLTDMSVTDFVNRYKLTRAIAMLKEQKMNVSEIAYTSGFQDPKYFSRVFKKFYGMSPSNYLANLAGAGGETSVLNGHS